MTRGADRRTGSVIVTADPNNAAAITFSDDFVETNSTGVTLSVTQTGSTVSLIYSSTDTGTTGVILTSVCSLA